MRVRGKSGTSRHLLAAHARPLHRGARARPRRAPRGRRPAHGRGSAHGRRRLLRVTVAAPRAAVGRHRDLGHVPGHRHERPLLQPRALQRRHLRLERLAGRHHAQDVLQYERDGHLLQPAHRPLGHWQRRGYELHVFQRAALQPAARELGCFAGNSAWLRGALSALLLSRTAASASRVRTLHCFV